MINKKTFGTLGRRLCAVVIAAVIGLSMIACDEGNTDNTNNNNILPEDMPTADRWWKWTWEDPPTTATVDVSVDDDGVCTITVGGTPAEKRYEGFAAYSYTQKQGVSYKYTFEAWTQSGERDLTLEYFENNDTKIYLSADITITETRQTYTVYGAELPVLGEYPALRFQCADKLGTFYVKVLKIEEYKIVPSTLTVNGIPAEYNGKYVLFSYGLEDQTIYGLNYDPETETPTNVQIKNGSVSLPMWSRNDYTEEVTKYSGNDVLWGCWLDIYNSEPWDYSPYGGIGSLYLGSITFSKGGAIIDYSTSKNSGGWGDEEPLPDDRGEGGTSNGNGE